VIVLLLIGLVLIATAVVLLSRGLSASRLRAVETIGRIEHYGFVGGVDLQPTDGLRGFLDSAASGMGVFLTDRLNIVNEERLRKNLIAAGMYQTTPRQVVGYSLLLAIVLPVVCVWLAVAAGASSTLAVLAAIFLAVIGWVIPGFVVQQRAESRLHRIDRSMPELIDLLVVTVEAGLSLSAALQLAGDRLKGPLGEELRIVLQEQRMGLTPVQALENMTNRCPTPAVESFVRAMMQGQLLGVSIGQILRSLAIEMRKRRRAAAEQQAQKAPIKMLFPLVFMIFPSLFVVILGPAVVSIFHALHS
jgi:tight adherence protein C